MTILIMLLPLIFSGIVHMIIVKMNYFSFLKIPLSLKYFGANKTYRGFIVMILATVLGVYLCQIFLNKLNIDFYKDVSLWKVGALLGFFYALFELPNSYIKRRLGIEPGKRSTKYSFLFSLYDQMDSGLGLLLVYYYYLDIDLVTNFLMIFIGTFTHLFFNFSLYLLKIRKEPF